MLSVERGHILKMPCDVLVLGMFEGVPTHLSGMLAEADKALEGVLATQLKEDGFQGKRGERLVIPTFGRLPSRKIAVIGLGPRTECSTDAVRLAGAQIIRMAREAKTDRVCTVLIGASVAGMDAREASAALGEGLLLGAYRFHAYHGTGTPDHAAPWHPSAVVCVDADRHVCKAASTGLERARTLADATMLARDLVNTPSRDMGPAQLADVARSLAVRHGRNDRAFGRIRCTTLDKEKMEKLGMQATLAVAAGSVHEPVGIHLTYEPARRAKKRVAIIGKAVTFDSGGLNIKPEQGMTTMKIDMAGAATVIGLFKALSVLRVPVEVHGVFLAVENMPSGSAYRPGDVVRAMNGTTIEILNTDAEGRVTLADALSYAVKKIKPDTMVDLATLTGAAVVALGEEITAIMGNDKQVVKELLTAAHASGEPMWELPLHASYQEALRSKIADINNTGGRGAGTIKAGLFLQRFVANVPWAHLDIAGPSYAEKETRPDTPVGGTGVGVRTLVRWLEQLVT